MQIPLGLHIERGFTRVLASVGSCRTTVPACCAWASCSRTISTGTSRQFHAYRDLLLFEEPRSYQMGRNNLTHAADTGGVSVVLAQHYEGWSGDPREARANPAK